VTSILNSTSAIEAGQSGGATPETFGFADASARFDARLGAQNEPRAFGDSASDAQGGRTGAASGQNRAPAQHSVGMGETAAAQPASASAAQAVKGTGVPPALEPLMQGLSPDDRAMVASATSNADAGFVGRLGGLLSSDGFKSLSPEAKSAILNHVNNHRGDLDMTRMLLNGCERNRNMILGTAGEEWQERQAKTQLISGLSTRDITQLGEIGSARQCMTDQGFKGWLGENKLEGLYRSVYLPLMDPRSREAIKPAFPYRPAARDLAGGMEALRTQSQSQQMMYPVDRDHPVMTPAELSVWKRFHPRTQDDLIAINDKLSGLTAPAYIAWMQGAPDETVDALNGLMMTGGAVAAPYSQVPVPPRSNSSPRTEAAHTAPAPAEERMPAPDAPFGRTAKSAVEAEARMGSRMAEPAFEAQVRAPRQGQMARDVVLPGAPPYEPGRSTSISDWTVGKNSAGGTVYRSTTPVDDRALHVEGMVKQAGNRRVTIYSGYHLTQDGAMRPDRSLYLADETYYGKYPNVTVKDVSHLSDAQRSAEIDNTPGVVVVNTCYGANALDQ